MSYSKQRSYSSQRWKDSYQSSYNNRNDSRRGSHSDRSNNDYYDSSHHNDNRNSGQKQWQKGNSGGSYSNKETVMPPDETFWYNFPPVHKNFYTESSVTAVRTQFEIKKFLDANTITITGGNKKNPILNFSEAHFPCHIQNKLMSLGFAKPTSIQSICWPYAQSGNDLIGIAKTGSGKTLGFLLPALVHVEMLIGQSNRYDPIAVIMLPTRELAQQVSEVVQSFTENSNIKFTCVYGGESRWHQISRLERGCDVLIATPGRLIDFLESGKVKLSACTYLVLDEADRMLDMGFEPQIRKILKYIRPDRQTLMWSATWPEKIRKLASDFLRDPIHFQVGSSEVSANHNITQHIWVCKENEKYQQLLNLMKEIMKTNDNKTIVFIETKRKCQQVADDLYYDRFEVSCIHGGKSQEERTYAIKSFRDGQTPVLVATDVASRGLDVHDVRYVINFDFPGNIESYVQRIGRTARAGQKGTSHSFFMRKDGKNATSLIKVLKEAKQNVNPELYDFENNLESHRPATSKRSYQSSYSSPTPCEMSSNNGEMWIMTADGPQLKQQ